MRHALALALALAAMASVLAAPAKAQVVDRVVVVVNGDIITQYDLDKALEPILARYKGRTLGPEEEAQLEAFRKQLLDRQITDLLLEQEAKKYKVETTDKDVDAEISRIKDNAGISETEFLKKLSQQGMTQAEFRAKLKREIQKQRVIGYMVKSKVVVSDSEVEAAYAKKAEAQTGARLVHLRMILLPPGEDAAPLKKRIESGQLTFEQAADKFTVGPGAGSGGDIGDLEWKDLLDSWRMVLEVMKPGQISPPVDIDGQSALLQYVGDRAGAAPDADRARERLREELYREKLEKIFDEYMTALKKKSVIEYK